MSPGCVAIVDPFSSGAMLAESLVSRGATCVAIESSPHLPKSMKSHFDPASFCELIQHRHDLQVTLRALRSHRPIHVIAGFESGVELAEVLAEQLNVPCNAITDRASRRDKFLMTEAVKRRGLRTALQFQSRDLDELAAWVRHHLDWPVIAKPPKSVASDHVRLCRDERELREAATSILVETNFLGESNPRVLVQEYLRGTEYVVDTVSHEGLAKLTAIWRYDRPAGRDDFICYDAMRLLPYQGPRQDALRDYAFEVLYALGIRFGPAHCELMWVGEEPVFVELGARLSAGINAVLSRICGGPCQLDETVNVLLAPDQFRSTLDDIPRLDRHAVNVFLMPARPGRLVRTHHVDRLQQLPTLYSLSLATDPGDELLRVAGRVTLVDQNVQAIENDIAVIRALEQDGIFEVEEG